MHFTQNLQVAALALFASTASASPLSARADCKTLTVVSGDSCGTLASKCGISGADFVKYNPNPNLCSTLVPSQQVCCSAGSLPDNTPKPGADGICATYTVQSGDYCYGIAQSAGISVDSLESYNAKTWQWKGCNLLLVGMKICLSTGKPPLPATDASAVCGPTVPGTTYPADGNLAGANPCPTEGDCCSIWGQCGTGSDFCGA